MIGGMALSKVVQVCFATTTTNKSASADGVVAIWVGVGPVFETGGTKVPMTPRRAWRVGIMGWWNGGTVAQVASWHGTPARWWGGGVAGHLRQPDYSRSQLVVLIGWQAPCLGLRSLVGWA
ncbi:hypothetical protein B0T17DRAFT_543894 [Bombardia bombarda]|uniref:Uncharacterized protein n=1 Tax=Bombardia bombarda TaxID=252184 RepID=A0AA39TMB0_9PEZI|nr:hypothetical protein B0T17DRAFT_543894 [Bombardia bombarda]